MKMNKISQKLIKPHTPTPQNLKNYKISFIDKDMMPMNIGVILFYESKPENYYRQLEDSLAKVLIDFYPLAGRFIKSNLAVDCNDDGAELIEAEAVDEELMDLVAKGEDTEQLNALLPEQHFRLQEAADYPLLSVQATRFPRGGLVVALSISHRVFDLASIQTFIAAWSNATNPDNNHSHNQVVGGTHASHFNLSRLLPRQDGDWLNQFYQEDQKIVRKRLVFDKVALAGLVSKIRPRARRNINPAAADGERSTSANPSTTTRSHGGVSGARVVCAVIAKALIEADRAKHGRSRDFVIFQPVDMRGRTSLPQLRPEAACGNFSIFTITRRVAASEAERIGIQELVDLLGDSVEKGISDHAGILSDPHPDSEGTGTGTGKGREMYKNGIEHLLKEICNPNTSTIGLTNISKFRLYEAADFGWGKPVWTTIGPQRSSLHLIESNKEGDQIEAWLHLHQDDATYFDQINISNIIAFGSGSGSGSSSFTFSRL